MPAMPLQRIHERLAKHCKEVYDDAFLTAHEHISNDCTGVQCAFLVEEGQLVVCFRGSDSETDWMMNMLASLTEYPRGSGCFLHSGFLVQWVSIESRFKEIMAEMLESYKEEVKEVVFCGHSAGSQCLIAAYSTRELLDQLGLSGRVVTFGAPRVGNAKFKEVMESSMKCERIVLDRDVITRVPVVGFYHVGSPYQIRDDGVLERDTSTVEHLSWMLLGARHGDAGIRDHFASNYYSAIRRVILRGTTHEARATGKIGVAPHVAPGKKTQKK
jgi:hypothetical protein